MNNFSLHTVELRMYLDPQNYEMLYSKLYNLSRGNNRVEKDDFATYFYCFRGQGIELRMREEKYRQYLAVKLSLNCLQNGKESVELIKHEDIPNALDTANSKLTSLLGEGYSLERFELWRVDFCVNLNVESQENVTAYIDQMYKTQFKKAYKTRGLKKPKINKELGFTAIKDADSEIAVYDKYQVLLSHNDSQAEQAKNILRVEFRLLNRRTVDKYIKESGVRNKIMRAAVESENIIVGFMERFCMNADYYKFKKAKKIVSSFVESDKKLEGRMLRMLELTARLHGVHLAKKALMNEDKKLSHRYFTKMMEGFSEIGVNVVTLGKKSEVKYLPSLFRYLYEK